MKSARIFANDFNRLVEATKRFVSESNHRPCNQYIKMEFCAAENQVTATAVDGYRLSVEHSVISDCEEDFVVYIKSNTKLPREQYARISLEDDGKEAVIRCNGLAFGYTQPEQDGFDWRKAIPTTEAIYRIGFNGNYLLSALQSAKASVGGSLREPVVLEFRSNVEPILLRTNKNDIKMVLPIRIKEV